MVNQNHAGHCRNCGQRDMLKDLGFVGQVSPFFLSRVLGLRLGAVRSSTVLKALVRRTLRLPQAFLNRLNPSTVLIEMQLCGKCSFIQTTRPFHEDDINRLYADYREDSYNRERVEMEPSYARCVAHVGRSPVEVRERRNAATAFLRRSVVHNENFSILDYGGSDGTFIPDLDGTKYVYEISQVKPVSGVSRVHSQADLTTYSLVQLAHVIEHVVQPLELVTQVSETVEPGGYLYVETPQELSDLDRKRVAKGDRMVSVHEHINSYCVESVTTLIRAAGLYLVDIEATLVNIGWGEAVHIRALGQKR